MLLDTQVFIWLSIKPERIAPAALAAIVSSADIFLSSISITEIIIKHQKSPATFPFSFSHAEKAIAASRLSVLDYTARHAAYLAILPAIHKDPFDRMLIAQALGERLPLVSADKAIAAYQAEYPGLEGKPVQLKIIPA